jgi:hypothetical protein
MPKKPATPGLLKRICNQLEPDLEAWLVDIGRFALIIAGLIFAHYGFRLLRVAGVSKHYIDWLEKEELTVDGIVYTLFLIAILRRSLLTLFGGRSSPGQLSP